MATTILPQDVTEVDLAFPAKCSHLMPEMEDIPAEFKQQRNYWVGLQQEWFFRGLEFTLKPKAGIDRTQAIRHLTVIQSSFEPKHEHKEAAVAYLLSLWFEHG